jgi:alpha-tubulin suppressor-like RCC1 family protein
MTAAYHRRIVLIVATSGIATAIACASNKSATAPPSSGGTPTNIVEVSGDSQTGAWGATIPAPLVVKVTDSVGSPVTNTSVAWLVSFDDAPQVQSLTTTNAAGETQVTPTLGGSPGAFSVSAAINGHSVTFSGASNIALASGSASFAPGIFASCGLTKQGTAFCWGSGISGQLGNGDTAEHEGAVPVSGGHTFTQVSIGNAMACGIATGGSLYCWGSPAYSSFGNGTAAGGATSYTPVAAGNGRTFTQIAVGQPTVCGLSGGVAYCWGDNSSGAVGNGNTTNEWTPVAVALPGSVTLTYIGAAGGFNCGLATTGAVYCWGDNSLGTLGTGSSSPASSSTPLLVTGGHTFTSLAVANVGVCGLTAAGTVYCWGEILNGNGTSGIENAPTAIQQTGLTFTQLSAAGVVACALTAAGAAYCWGNNTDGALGSGSFSTSGLTPVAVTGGLKFSTIGSGGILACGLTTSSATYCWGTNTSDQLGLSGTADTMYAAPQPVPGMGGGA